MSNHMIYMKEPDFLHEAALCVYYREGKNERTAVEDHERHGLTPEQAQALTASVRAYREAILRDISPLIAENVDLLPYFDRNLSGTEVFRNHIALSLVGAMRALGIEDPADGDAPDRLALEIVRSSDEAEPFGQDESGAREAALKEDPVRFITGIESLDEGQRLFLIGFFVNRRALVGRLYALLRAVSEACRRHYGLVREETEALMDALKADEQTLHRLLDELHVRRDLPAETIRVYVTPLDFRTLGIKDGEETCEIHIGLHFLTLSRLTREREADDISGLKAAADPTRWKLLRLLAAERLYPNQIAERLSLTPATILHHIEILISAGLVNIAVEGERTKRARYESNPAALRALAGKLERLAQEAEHEKQ